MLGATPSCKASGAVNASDQGLLRSACTAGMTAGAVMPMGKLAVPAATAAGARASSEGDDGASVVKQANLNTAAPRPSQYGMPRPLRAAVCFERHTPRLLSASLSLSHPQHAAHEKDFGAKTRSSLQTTLRPVASEGKSSCLPGRLGARICITKLPFCPYPALGCAPDQCFRGHACCFERRASCVRHLDGICGC